MPFHTYKGTTKPVETLHEQGRRGRRYYVCTRCGIQRQAQARRVNDLCRDCIDVERYPTRDDDNIFAAHQAGTSISQIARDNGITRDTVRRIIDRHQEHAA